MKTNSSLLMLAPLLNGCEPQFTIHTPEKGDFATDCILNSVDHLSRATAEVLSVGENGDCILVDIINEEKLREGAEILGFAIEDNQAWQLEQQDGTWYGGTEFCGMQGASSIYFAQTYTNHEGDVVCTKRVDVTGGPEEDVVFNHE